MGVSTPASVRRLLFVIAVSVLTLLTAPSAVSAHTDLDFTLPDDGASVSEPVAEVTVAFTAAVELVGNGFEALDPQGTVLQPPVVTDDDRVFRLLFDPPLAGGAVGVRYEIRADDGHVLSGSFSFVVDAAVTPTTTPATSPPTEPPATEPPATDAPATTATSPEATEPSPTTTAAEASAAPATSASTTSASTTVAATEESADDGSSIGVILAIVAAIAIGLGGFFVLRSRTSGEP